MLIAICLFLTNTVIPQILNFIQQQCEYLSFSEFYYSIINFVKLITIIFSFWSIIIVFFSFFGLKLSQNFDSTIIGGVLQYIGNIALVILEIIELVFKHICLWSYNIFTTNMKLLSYFRIRTSMRKPLSVVFTFIVLAVII